MRPATPLLAVLLVASVCAAGGIAWHRLAAGAAAARPAGAATPAQPVGVAVAERGDVPLTIDGLGTALAAQTITVRARVGGQLARIAFRDGQSVQRGQLLAVIDPRPYEAALLQAEGQLMRDEALLRNARLDLARYRDLLAQDSVAAQQVDTQAALVSQLEGTVRSDRGAVDAARLQLSYTQVLAPATGRVGLAQVDAGNLVQPTDAAGLVVLTQVDPATVVFSVPAEHLPAIQASQRGGGALRVEARDRAATLLLATGRLTAIDNLIDTASGTVRLKAEFRNTDGTLFPNQFVTARLQLGLLRDATLVPSAAVQRGTEGPFVYVVEPGGRVAVRAVGTGPAAGDRVVITHGVNAGETVVVDGTDRLRDGMQVEPITAAARKAPPAVPHGARAAPARGPRP